MIIQIAMCLLAILPSAVTLNADTSQSFWARPQASASPKIKILIAHDVNDAVVSVHGKYRLLDPNTNKYQGLGLAFINKKSAPVEVTHEGLKWGEEFPDMYQIQIQPACSNTITTINGIDYKGVITIYNVDRNNKTVSIVNELPVEEYLTYVLPGKYSESLAPEALAAGVILARTTTYYQFQNPRSPYWTVDGRHMGYQGYRSNEANSPLRNAIAHTRNMILSRTGTYEGTITPFIALWPHQGQNLPDHLKDGVAQISLSDASGMAENGEHAANILRKAFPNTSIQIIKGN
jgi:stage II sporulation protein D